MNNTMKMLMAAAILSLPMVMNAQPESSITFTVDEGLQPVEEVINTCLMVRKWRKIFCVRKMYP